MDDIPRADEIRTLVKDIWDLRVAKLRSSSLDGFVKHSDISHAKVRGFIEWFYSGGLLPCVTRIHHKQSPSCEWFGLTVGVPFT